MSEVLTAETGRVTGSRASNRLRREGKVPGVVYGMGMEPVAVALAWPELRRALLAGGTNAPIRLSVEGREHLTLVREIQRHPIRREVTHIDFLAVDPDQAVDVDVPLVITGLEEGDEGSDLVLLLHALAVSAKPNAIPAEIGIDAAAARAAGGFHVADLQLPAGVVTSLEGDIALVTVASEEDLVVGDEADSSGDEA